MEAQTLDFHTRDEQEALLKVVTNPRHKVLLLLMLDAGCRVSEACSRQWEDCDFRQRTLSIYSLKKRGKEHVRTLPLSARLYDAFAELLETKGVTAKGYIFPSKKEGEPISRHAAYKMLKRLGDDHPQLGETKPHKLRHTFATNLVANGAELLQVRDLLGHEDARTTQIYTHSDPAQLRALMDANASRAPHWQVWKKRLVRILGFTQPQRRINLITTDAAFLVGRDKELKTITDLVNRDISVILTGSIGVGKTHLLQSVAFDRPTLVIDDAKEFKKSIAGALLHILGDKEAVASMLYQTSDLKALEKKVSGESLPNLVQTLIDATQPREYLLKIGNVDSITPTVIKALEKLKEHFTIITTAREIKMGSTSFVWDFERVELKPLDRPDSRKLIYRLIGDLEVSDLDAVMTKVYETADGNPRMIRELCERLRKEPVLSLEVVNEVADGYLGRQTQEIDMSVYLLLILGGFVGLRYYGRETGEKDLQFIGGCIMIVLLFARYFFNSTRRKVL